MSKRGRIRIATCQFSVSGQIKRNADQIRRQMFQAKRKRADIAHFPEAALSGYAGKDVETWAGYDWDLLKQATREICSYARKLGLWVVLGSAHPLTSRHKPHNSLYLIEASGRIVDRYDKRFCTSKDLKHYTPGDHFVVFSLNGVKCAMLICYDVRFPEVYRKHKKLGVQCIFQSFYNARAEGRGIHYDIMRQSMQCRAATNYIWASAANSSGYYQGWPSIFIQPDGHIAASLPLHRASVIVNTVDTTKSFYDASGSNRGRAMKGVLNTGKQVSDPRSRDRTGL